MKKEILRFCLEKGYLIDKDVCDVLGSLEDVNIAKHIIEGLGLKLNQKIITKATIDKNSDLLKQVLWDEKEKTCVEKICITLGMNIEISKQKSIAGMQEESSLKTPLPVVVSLDESIESGSGLKETHITNLGADRDNNMVFYGNGSGRVKVLSSHRNIEKKVEVGDFVKHFRARFLSMKKILQERPELESLTSINKIGNTKQAVSIIGLVIEKRITKNKNIILEVEDLTGKINILINKNRAEIYEKAKDILLDDAIGIKGVGDKNLLFVNDVIYPDAFIEEKVRLNADESIAFVSDFHVGSKMFLKENVLKFIDWINGQIGDEEQRKEALKVKYLLIVGDTIDGVGVFPGQEAFLDIPDIREQYKQLAEYLKMIRKDVTMVLCPGQHDSVRVAEPQPTIGTDYGAPLHEISNLILVSNPAMIEITDLNGFQGAAGNGGSSHKSIKILMYHGASFHSIIGEIEDLRFNRGHDHPTKVMKQLLKRRHLSPTHSFTPYIPDEKRDPIMIDIVPDVVATGDLHRSEVDMYNNILLISSSCWQSITPFEEKVGNDPDPCKVPVLNLKTRAIKILDFT